MIYIQLLLQFFHIGLFSFGGGYATLPFLYHIAETQNWYSVQQLTDMIAVSSVTPGPVGVNVATFAGFTTAGIFGALIATSAVILPSYIIVIIVSKLLNKFKSNKIVQDIVYTLKPAGCGLLAAVGIEMYIKDTNMLSSLILAVLIIIAIKQKHSPLFYLSVSAIIGLVTGLFNINI